MTVESHPVPDAYDLHVGARIRQQRKYAALSLPKLADMIGVTYQQLQRYENASNRVAASTLVRLARALDVPVSYFFAGIEGLRT
jgi:transcriptional regulator with XRE-family HTH domain